MPRIASSIPRIAGSTSVVRLSLWIALSVYAVVWVVFAQTIDPPNFQPLSERSKILNLKFERESSVLTLLDDLLSASTEKDAKRKLVTLLSAVGLRESSVTISFVPNEGFLVSERLSARRTTY